MHCPQCNHENPEHARSCLECGTRLARTCPECGIELPAQARFCLQCGAQVGAAPAAAPAVAAETLPERLQRLVPKEFAERLLATRGQVTKERRVVTMLFSDVKGSTTIAEHLDPEDWAEIMDGAFEFLIAPIYRYEGTLARLMGDAILAFFGAPIAHEDDPERACRAALEITARAAEYAEKLEKEREITGFNVRVGINTGLVVVGEAGSDLRVEYAAMGDAVNLAARMESAAEPGTVLITEDTHKLIAPLFETEALGSIQVKGRTQPVSTYRVLAAKDVPRKVRGIPGLESPLVGREAEFTALQEALQRLQAGVGGVVTVVGEAGIGKSRLVAEVRNLPHVVASPYSGEAIPKKESGDCFGKKMPRNDKRLQWIEGRCVSYGHSVAYLLWLDVLRALLGVSLEDAPQAVRERLQEQVQAVCPDHLDDVYPYLARLMSLPLEDNLAAKLDDMEGQDLKAQTFQAVQTLIECAAKQQPLVLVCEDLHWADQASMELLEQLLALTDHAALLFICMFRPNPEHASWGLREVAARLYRHRHTDLWLQPLSASESDVLVGNLLRIEQLHPALKQRILDAAEGNPFYVEEILRSMIDQEAIVRDDATGRWQATESAVGIAIPDTLQGVLLARIDRLQEETKRVLQMASVIGRLFLYRVLKAIAKEERRLDEHLLTLLREEMIRERARIPELEYIFKHELTREAAYNGLLKKQRRVFHRQTAQALERLFPERVEEQLGLLAHHWERARDTQKATEYLLRAGDQARLLYAHQEAIEYYQRALVFLKEREQHEPAARTLMKLGLTYHTAFDFQRARDAYDEGFVLWRRVGEGEPAVPPPPAPHSFKVVLMGRPDSLDSAMAHGAVSLQVIEQLFSGVVRVTPELDVVPDVAQSWEVLEGGRKYIFHLRDDVIWSDSAPVTARDFEYAWKRVLNPGTATQAASLLYDVKGGRAFHQAEVSDPDSVQVRALDTHTLAVELEEPTGHFLQLLADPRTYAVPQHVVDVHGEAWSEAGNIVTNGPFQLEAWRRGKLMTLVRNPGYHGHFAGNVQRVELTPLLGTDWLALLAKYEADELDVLPIRYFPLAEMNRARQRHSGEYVSAPMPATWYIVFVVSKAPFDDIRVRRAFVLATDRDARRDDVTAGALFPATGGLVPPGMPGHSPGIGLPYDPDRGRQLLAEAGYPGGHGFPEVEVLIWPGTEPSFQNLQARWREKLGVELTWQSIDQTMFPERLRTEPPHMVFQGWRADYLDPDNCLRVGFPRPWSGWRNKVYHTLVEDARRVMDQRTRMRLYREADRLLMEEAAVLPMAYGRQDLLVKPWVKVPVSAAGDLIWKDIIIEPH